MNNSYGGTEVKNIYESPRLYFFTVGYLSFLAAEPDLRYIYNFPRSFEL